MQKPTRERQNKWINDYIIPILDLDFGRVVQNYKQNRMMKEMTEAGVFHSLARLETQGTSLDKVMGEMRKGIRRAEEYNEIERYKEGIRITKEYNKIIDFHNKESRSYEHNLSADMLLMKEIMK